MTNTEQQLAIKYGALIPLSDLCSFFKVKSETNLMAMANKGQFPVPILTLKRPNAQRHGKGVSVKLWARYLDQMETEAVEQFNEDMEAMKA